MVPTEDVAWKMTTGMSVRPRLAQAHPLTSLSKLCRAVPASQNPQHTGICRGFKETDEESQNVQVLDVLRDRAKHNEHGPDEFTGGQPNRGRYADGEEGSRELADDIA